MSAIARRRLDRIVCAVFVVFIFALGGHGVAEFDGVVYRASLGLDSPRNVSVVCPQPIHVASSYTATRASCLARVVTIAILEACGKEGCVQLPSTTCRALPSTLRCKATHWLEREIVVKMEEPRAVMAPSCYSCRMKCAGYSVAILVTPVKYQKNMSVYPS